MVYKGTQKRMIMLRNTGSGIFEEAYFIIRDRVAQSAAVTESDMIKEANRIIAESGLRGMNKMHARAASGGRRLLWFAAGCLFGAGLTLITWLLIA